MKAAENGWAPLDSLCEVAAAVRGSGAPEHVCGRGSRSVPGLCATTVCGCSRWDVGGGRAAPVDRRLHDLIAKEMRFGVAELETCGLRRTRGSGDPAPGGGGRTVGKGRHEAVSVAKRQ